MSPSPPPLGAESLEIPGETSTVYAPDRIPGVDPERLRHQPRTIRILLENLLRHAGESGLRPEVIRSVATEGTGTDLPFYPSRILLQDFTGVPVLVDLAALRAAAVARGVEGARVRAAVPVDLVIDHSVQVDSYGEPRSLLINLDREFERNAERYDFLRWARTGFRGLRVVPPGNGIVHQVNLEHLARVVDRRERDGVWEAFPDTVLGTDSHTTMVNGLGVLGWGVGGIEAEAALLGEPYLLPKLDLLGVELTGTLPEGATATDLVLTVTHLLRAKGVVDKFVEFFGPGLVSLPVPDRATISNMCPEYGATAALFPIDAATIAYLKGTGRPAELIVRVEAYARRLGLWRDPDGPDPRFADVLRIDLSRIGPTVSGPRNPEESHPLAEVPDSFRAARDEYRRTRPRRPPAPDSADVPDGAVVIAAITSCTNTSNPSVMVGAGLLAARARARGLAVPRHVKTSLAPGSRVVTEYLERAGLLAPLGDLGFSVVGYGCTTCIGNSGPLPPAVAEAVKTTDGYVAAVLSGNRNFEARIHNQVRANYLASPMLVVAYALAGRVDIDFARDPIGTDPQGAAVHLADLWPSAEEIRSVVERALDPKIFVEKYRRITEGDPHWDRLPDRGDRGEYDWDADSTYLRIPPYFDLPAPAAPTADGTLLHGARVLALLGDRVSTDHISPAGEIPVESPAGRYLTEHGVRPSEFNTYGSRRGNHEVLVRGTFANVRLRNALAQGREGGFTTHQPDGALATIHETAERYRTEGTPLIVIAGANYGQGSSRDWAAKGPLLLGVRAVVARGFERIHRGNLIGMGVLPIAFRAGEGATELGLTGTERYSITLAEGTALVPRARLRVRAERDDRTVRTFEATLRIDSATELAYYQAGGILPYVLGKIAPK